MFGYRPRAVVRAIATFACFFGGVQAAHADYLKDDRINLIVGYEAGGGYDIYARVLAPYLTKYLPNNPRIVVQNMVGAGSLKATNHLYNVVPKDGTTLGMVGQSIPQMELLNQPGVQFKADKFNWIGRISDVHSLIITWADTGVKTIEDAKTKPIAVSVGGPISGSTLYVMFLNELIGTKIRATPGYTPSQAMLAMERGEVDGLASILLLNLQTVYPHLVAQNKLNILVQIGTERDPGLPNVPLLSELAKTPDDKKILEAISSSDVIGRTVLAPPNVP